MRMRQHSKSCNGEEGSLSESNNPANLYANELFIATIKGEVVPDGTT
jgi:hypothetical protein